MTTVAEDVFVISVITDNHDAALKDKLTINDSEYVHIMRGIIQGDGESGLPVSAFNSSI